MTTETLTGANTGGFEDRYRVTRTDGKPIKAERRYIVLAYDGSDPEAIGALKYYAQLKQGVNDDLARDIFDALENPQKYPSQHD